MPSGELKVWWMQNSIPFRLESAIELVRKGENPELTTRQKHIRECFVVVEEGADKERIEEKLKPCRTICGL